MKSVIYICLVVFIGNPVFSTEMPLPRKISVSVYNIAGMIEFDNEQLPYNKILSMIARDLGTEVQYSIYHGLRASRTFQNNQSDCIFPGSTVGYPNLQVIETIPVYVAKAYFFAFQLVTAERILDTRLPQLRIGFYRGNTFGGNIEKLAHHKLTPLNSGADIRSLIGRGRIDVFLNYMPDSADIVDVEGKLSLQYDETSLFYEQNDSFVCHDTPELRSAIDALNLKIKYLSDSGQIAAILAQLLNKN